MSYKSQLKDLYETELKPKLAEMEAMRSVVKNRIILIILCFVSMFASIFVSVNFPDIFSFIPFDPIIFFFFFLILTIASVFYYVRAYNPYKKKFKNEISGQIFSLIAKDMKYSHENCIDSSHYHQSKIFQTGVDRYKGDDYLCGKVGEVDFQFSELHTEYKKVTRDSEGRRKEKWYTIFKGIFIVAEFNKNITRDTYVLPDNAERILGRFGGFLQKNKFGKHAEHLIKLENTEFEKEFLVYGDDQIESRYILTPKIMESFLRIRKNFNRPVFASFRGNHVYMAISLNKNMFEPTIFSSGVKFQNIETMGRLIESSIGIIKELELNQDIWNKKIG